MITLLLLLAIGASDVAAEGRSEIEIHQTRWPNAAPRYSIPLSIAGRAPIEVMLDTGSTGLRLLPAAGPVTEIRGARPQRYAYRNGVVLTGKTARAELAIGQFRTEVEFSATSAVACAPERPQCPAANLSPAQFRIGGATPTDGFLGILGAGLRAGDVDNPLTRTRDQAWILLLPRPGDATAGKLILNPTAAERARFTLFPLARDPRGDGSDWVDTVPTCLVAAEGAKRLCAPTLLDSGAPGLNVISRSPPPDEWPAGAKAELRFGQTDPLGPRQEVTLGRGSARLVFTTPPANLPWEGLNAGDLPFHDFAVLYDAKAGTIGLAPRQAFMEPAAP